MIRTHRDNSTGYHLILDEAKKSIELRSLALREPEAGANLKADSPELVLLVERFDGDVVFGPPPTAPNDP